MQFLLTKVGKMHMVYVQLSKFNKTEQECLTDAERLMFSLKNAHKLLEMPKSFNNEELLEIFDVAKISNLSEEEYMTLEQKRKYESAYFNTLAFAKRKATESGLAKGIARGLEQGMEQGLQKGMQQGLQQGMELGIKQGIQQGRLEGKAEGKTSVARNLRDMGLSVLQIAKATGLSEQQVARL